MDFLALHPDIKADYLKTVRGQGLYAVVSKEAANRMYEGGLQQQIRDHCKALVDGGVSTFEATCRSENWLDVAKYIMEAATSIDGVIPAVGTNANILTVHQAVESGIPVIVAAQGFKPLSGSYAVVEKQTGIADEFVDYIGKNAVRFRDALKLNDEEVIRLQQFPLEMDPIAYAKARGVIMIPAFYTPTEFYDLMARGAFDGQKVFNFADKHPALWKKQFDAIPDVYEDKVSLCATGGINANNLKEVISLPFMDTAGASSLIGKTPKDTFENAKKYRSIVAEARSTGS